MAGPILTGKVVFVDLATKTLQKIQRMAQQVNTTLATQTGVLKAGAAQAQQAIAVSNQYAKAIQNVGAATQAATQHTRDMHITLTGMLKVMFMFAINLQIIRAVTSPYTFLRGAVEQVRDFQTGIRGVNALLRLNKDELKIFSKGIQEIGALYGITTADMLDSTKELASSISALNIGALSQQEAIIKILRSGAKLAVIDNTDLKSSVGAIRAMMAALSIDITNVDKVMSLLWATVDVGTIRVNEIEGAVGKWAGVLSTLAPKDGEGRLKFLQETLTMFAALTNVFPVAEAETATSRILTSLTKEANGVAQLRRELESVTGIPLGLDVYTSKGPSAWFKNLDQAIGKDSKLVAAIVRGQRDITTLTAEETEAASGALSTRLMAALFPNIRASTPLLFLQSLGEQLDKINTDLIDTQVNVKAAFEEMYNTADTNWKRFGALYDAVRVSLFGGMMQEASNVMKNVADAVHKIVFSEDFDELNAAEKIRRILNAISKTVNDWWMSGGRESTMRFAQNFTAGLVIFLETAVIDNMSKFIDIGMSIASGVVAGMFKYILNPKNIGNPLVQMLAMKALGFKTKTSIAVPALASYGIGQLKGLEGSGGGDVGIPGSGGSGGGGGFMGTATSLATTLATFAVASAGMKYGTAGAKGLGKFALGGIGAGAGALWSRFGRSRGVGGLNYRSSNPWLGRWTTAPGKGQFVNARQLLTGIPSGMSLAQIIKNPRILFNMAKSPIGRIALPTILSSLALNGVGPFADQGGIGGILQSAAFGSSGPRAGQQDSMDWSALATGGLAGAGAGAAIGSFAGLPGALIGGAIGGGIGLLGSFRQQKANISQGSGAALDPLASRSYGPLMASSSYGGGGSGFSPSDLNNESAFLEKMGIKNAPSGMLGEIVAQATRHGITDPRELARFVAFNLGVVEAESNFTAKANAYDPTAADGWARSIGLYQLNTAKTGQGYGHSIENMLDPVYNTRVGAGVIASQWDPNKNFFEMAQASGHPGYSTNAQHVSSARRVESLGQEYLTKMTNSGTFIDTANGGVSSGASGPVVVKVDGNMIIQANNPQELAAALADGLYEVRG